MGQLELAVPAGRVAGVGRGYGTNNVPHNSALLVPPEDSFLGGLKEMKWLTPPAAFGDVWRIRTVLGNCRFLRSWRRWGILGGATAVGV